MTPRNDEVRPMCPLTTSSKYTVKHSLKKQSWFPGSGMHIDTSALVYKGRTVLTGCTIRWGVCQATLYTHHTMAEHTENPVTTCGKVGQQPKRDPPSAS